MPEPPLPTRRPKRRRPAPGPVSPLLEWAGLLPEDWGPPPPLKNARPDLGLEALFLALNKSGFSDAYVKDVKRSLLRKARRMGL